MSGENRWRVLASTFQLGKTITEVYNEGVDQSIDVVGGAISSFLRVSDPVLFGKWSADFTSAGGSSTLSFSPGIKAAPSASLNFEFEAQLYISLGATGEIKIMGQALVSSVSWEMYYNVTTDVLGFRYVDGSPNEATFDFSATGITLGKFQTLKISSDDTNIYGWLNGSRHATPVARSTIHSGTWTTATGNFIVGTTKQFYLAQFSASKSPNPFPSALTYTVPKTSYFNNYPLFPVSESEGSGYGPGYFTDLKEIASGYADRSKGFQYPLESFDAVLVNRRIVDLEKLRNLFYVCRGRGLPFLYNNPQDNRSVKTGVATSNGDQSIGTGDGTTKQFQLKKSYTVANGGTGVKLIHRPVVGSVSIAIDATGKTEGTDYEVDYGRGLINFYTAPALNEAITAGFDYYNQAFFDSDELMTVYTAFENGNISIPVVEGRF